MILTGTCSWTEKTLIQSGNFYPKEAKTAEARLRYYSDHFSTVEVDSTYYAIPDKRTTSLWATRTPDNFIFHIKAYGALTGHPIDPLTLPIDIRDMLTKKDIEQKRLYIKEPSLMKAIAKSFRESLYPLAMKGKLGVLVFQFPPWVQYKTSHIEYILSCKNAFSGLKIAVEFRHGSWLSSEHQDTVFHFLRKNQITYITVDEPQFRGLVTVSFVPAVTTDIAYFRFHGRNKENWLKKGIETSLRFAYKYSDEELRSFVSAIMQVSKRAETTCVMFNNCYGDYGIRNAIEMKEILAKTDGTEE